MMTIEEHRKCSYLLPAPGGEVVRGLLDQIDALNKELIERKRRLEFLFDEYVYSYEGESFRDTCPEVAGWFTETGEAR